jgi:hypothetical protein
MVDRPYPFSFSLYELEAHHCSVHAVVITSHTFHVILLDKSLNLKHGFHY